MQARPPRKFWRVARRLFRWCRVTILLLILTVLVLLLWLNRYGLPDFVRDRLVAELRLRGLDVQFSRLRLRWYRGLVADHVRFGRTDDPGGLRASAEEAELRLKLRPLLRGEMDLGSMALRDGRVILPVWGTNDTPREVMFDKINGELRFRTNDIWQLSGLQAEIFGVKVSLDGTVTNASIIRTWKPGSQRPGRPAFWHDLVYQIEQTRFETPTRVSGLVFGDARNPGTFRANLNIISPAIDSPWGKGREIRLTAQITPEPGQLIRADLKLQALEPDTRWGRAETLQLEANLTPSLTQWTPTNLHLSLEVRRPQTPWGRAATFTLRSDYRPNPADPASALVDYVMRGQQIQTPWARFAQAELTAAGVVSASNAWPGSVQAKLTFAGGEIDAGRAAAGTVQAALTLPSADVLQLGNTNYSWWTRLDQVQGDAEARLTAVQARDFDLKSVAFKASWRAPGLEVKELNAEVLGGVLQGAAKLDAATRRLSAELRSDFDPRPLTRLWTTNGPRWLEEIAWEKPPQISATVQLMLPVWTNQAAWKAADWREQVWPSLVLAGHLQSGPVSFRAVPVSSVDSDFACSNRTWRLPNLVITRPEGQLHIAHLTDELSGTYQFTIDSAIDPLFLRPFFPPAVQQVLDEFILPTPPLLRAELAGSWRQPEKISARATLTLTNLSYRAQPVLFCRTLVTVTNQILSFVEPQVVRTEGRARADSVVIDLPQKMLFINRATGALDIVAVTKTINTTVIEIMEPYHFLNPPRASAHGFINLQDPPRSDMRFTAEGGPFAWRSFRCQQITGEVHWAGTTMTLSNVQASFHGGHLATSAKFDFAVPQGADFALSVGVENIDFRSFMTDQGSTNELDGRLSGLLIVTRANGEIPRSWFGYGNVRLQDGLIWQMPVFGIFSPMLNTIKPGVGNARAKDAAGTFVITNSVVQTGDLQIEASGMRLNYSGTVDFDTRVNGQMEAELFRNTPVLGPIVSKVLWPVTRILKYKVTGTLHKPKADPLYIPKILMMPFHPFRTLRELVGEDKDSFPDLPLAEPGDAKGAE